MGLKMSNENIWNQIYILLLNNLVTEWKNFCKNINGMGVYQ